MNVLTSWPWRVCLLVAAVSASQVEAGYPRHHHGSYGGYNGSSYYSDPYTYNYNWYYSNPYSYEAQSLPYWMKPSYRSGGGNYSYSRPARYGAIAYSRTTGECGYSYNYYDQGSAEQSALSYCPASDGEIVCWAKNSYAALAVGDDVSQYGWGWSSSRADAERRALEACQSRTTNCRIRISFFTGN